MAITAAAMTSAVLAPTQSVVLAGPICAGAGTSGVFVSTVGPFCVPFNNGVNCQTFTAGLSPTLDATVYECVPRP